MAAFSLVLFLLLMQQAPNFLFEANYIKVPVTVLDENGRSVLGLTREDFTLLDEGEDRKIENFVLDESPIHVMFLLDSSGSVKEEIQEIKYATLRFAQSFDEDDRIAIVGFSDRVELLQNWTNDYDDIRKSLKKLKAGYRTALYDALWSTARDRLRNVAGKKVIILLTDGIDNESEIGYEGVMDELISSNTVLYIISRSRLVRSQLEDSERIEFLDRVMRNVLDDDESFVDIYFRAKEKSLNRLAEANGGRVFYPEKLPELGLSYLQIARELKNQYVLTFVPPTDAVPRFRKIDVLCQREVGSIFHREIYRAN